MDYSHHAAVLRELLFVSISGNNDCQPVTYREDKPAGGDGESSWSVRKKKKHIKTNTDNKTHVAPQMMQSGKCGKELKVCYLVLQQGKKDTERQRGAISGGNNA